MIALFGGTSTAAAPVTLALLLHVKNLLGLPHHILRRWGSVSRISPLPISTILIIVQRTRIGTQIIDINAAPPMRAQHSYLSFGITIPPGQHFRNIHRGHALDVFIIDGNNFIFQLNLIGNGGGILDFANVGRSTVGGSVNNHPKFACRSNDVEHGDEIGRGQSRGKSGGEVRTLNTALAALGGHHVRIKAGRLSTAAVLHGCRPCGSYGGWNRGFRGLGQLRFLAVNIMFPAPAHAPRRTPR
mmetsp:Transcript_30597/g.52250  ORF Transcript_30597/g.52250 Transcript_30597/m.52250 type:complete len:243 (-) Transcript_30597:377-1105(-)